MQTGLGAWCGGVGLGMAGKPGWRVVWAGCGACMGVLLHVAVLSSLFIDPRVLLFVLVALLRSFLRANERAEKDAGVVKQSELDAVEEEMKDSSDDDE